MANAEKLYSSNSSKFDELKQMRDYILVIPSLGLTQKVENSILLTLSITVSEGLYIFSKIFISGVPATSFS